MSERRRLAAIVSADVAGYSRLMGSDESGTLAALKLIRQEVIDPLVAAHAGRIVKSTGDGLLLEFASAVDAMRSVIAMQTTLAERNGTIPAHRRIEFRIGVNVGDIIIDGDDIFGDDVNIAARLQALAEPGGISLSQEAYFNIANRVDAVFADSGEQMLKNIARPVRVWNWVRNAAASHERADGALLVPDKPSIAVLAFNNLSGDAEQEYFCDGISEDIITELSRFRSLFVIARNSSFSYKGRSPDIRQVARELGVRYVLEGSIRRAGNRIRVTGQLIDAANGSHIWADRYDRVLEDIFAVQEELTQSIVRAIAPEIEAAEQERLRRRRPDSFGAYEIGARAWSKAWDAFVKADRPLRDAAIDDARAALQIDPRSTFALNALALAQWQHIVQGTATHVASALTEGIDAAERAIRADRLDSNAYAAKARLLVHMTDRDRLDEALEFARQAVTLNPNNMVALLALAFIENMAGQPESSLAHTNQALRISPRDPIRYLLHLQQAQAYLISRRYGQGVDAALRGIGEAPGFPLLHMMLAMNYVGQEDIGRARDALKEAQRLGPQLVAYRLSQGFPYRDPEDRRRVMAFLRVAAGLDDPQSALTFR